VAAGEPQPAVAVSAPTKTPDHVVRVGNADVMLGGAFTLNTLVSSRRTIGPAGSVFFLAPPDVTGRDNVIDMTAQYSRISLGIDIPAGDDWTVSARTLFTFFNGSLLNASYGFQPLFGYGSASNGRFTFSAGLMFELFKPGQVEVKEYYAELPIALKVSGKYHDVGSFAADVANLSRIVTLHNLSIAPAAPRDARDPKDTAGLLSMEATARTYRYLDPSEIAEQRRVAAEKTKGPRK
jgi:hypothetical protein